MTKVTDTQKQCPDQNDMDNEFEEEGCYAYKRLVQNHQEYREEKQRQFDTWKNNMTKRRTRLLKSVTQLTLNLKQIESNEGKTIEKEQEQTNEKHNKN